MKKLFLILLFLLLGVGGWGYKALNTPLAISNPIEFNLKNGSTARTIGRQLVERKVLAEPYSFEGYARLSGLASKFKSGVYLFEPGMTARDIAQLLASGKTSQTSITFIEGWTFEQMRAALQRHPDIRPTIAGLSDTQVLSQLDSKQNKAEGLFFPDTYFFSRGVSDIDVLKQAYDAMQKRLNQAWDNRMAGLPYQTPYDALIMASIVEKETGQKDERPQIAGVFVNRLKIGMRLQTDPTVIYGLGAQYNGNIRKKDLQTDTPYNTYTRAGLPPTPIAMPGQASIEAALQPADTKALYFVGKGDGSHVFSDNLQAHNKAVTQYQLKKK